VQVIRPCGKSPYVEYFNVFIVVMSLRILVLCNELGFSFTFVQLERLPSCSECPSSDSPEPVQTTPHFSHPISVESSLMLSPSSVYGSLQQSL
jgi:hypothetical protein